MLAAAAANAAAALAAAALLTDLHVPPRLPPQPCHHPCREACPGAAVVLGPLVDFSDPDSIRAFAADYLRQGRPLHILINNAGALPGAHFHLLTCRFLCTTEHLPLEQQQHRCQLQLPSCRPACPPAAGPAQSRGMHARALLPTGVPPFPTAPAAAGAYDSSRNYTKGGVAELCQVSTAQPAVR